tara:strand:+ start:4975 stop:6681 length:1707 start_codon:yes stop_codon:yes gene_type:complete
MAGGLLNLIAVGNQDLIVTGNPNKSFFKVTYNKYTNFGMQKYRIDQTGQTNINLNSESKYTFKISRYGDLLLDSYLVLTLPNIWSPVLKYKISEPNSYEYRPYEFKWIKNIGTQIIKDLTITIGGHIIQKFSGSYIQNTIQRDFTSEKKKIFDNMIGNIDELTNPEKISNRNNNYPNAFKINDDDIEPSIYERQLFIPINAWFTLLTTSAIPLVCLQYTDLEIHFTFRPLVELFTIKDITYDISNNPLNIDTNYYENFPRIKANQSKDLRYSFYRFIQPPPVIDIFDNYLYENTNNNLNMDIHLLTTQCFLDNEERNFFSRNIQTYLIKEIQEYDYYKVNKSSKIKIESHGLVLNWMWYFQRNDVADRNEWSNYTNWEYEENIPNNLIKLKDSNGNDIMYPYKKIYTESYKNILITGNIPNDYQNNNNKFIMRNCAIICDGKYREQELPSGVFSMIENFSRYNSNSKDGLYHYSFSINNDPHKYQPSGAFNTNKFKTIEFEFNTNFNPPLDLSSVNFNTICDPITQEPIGVTKEPTSIFKYNYDLHIYEEKYNLLQFQSGTGDLVYSR